MKRIGYDLMDKWLNRLYNEINSDHVKIESIKKFDRFDSYYRYYIRLIETVKNTLRLNDIR